MNVMHMSLITTLHLSHGHVVTTILHSVAAVHCPIPPPHSPFTHTLNANPNP